MELREYGRILLSRWWLLILLPLLAAGFSYYEFYTTPEPDPPTYMYDHQHNFTYPVL